MMEFFRGWRRKVGVVTLAMACVFMVGWVRSLPDWNISRTCPASKLSVSMILRQHHKAEKC